MKPEERKVDEPEVPAAPEPRKWTPCRMCGGDGGGEHCPRCGGNGFED